MQISDDIQGVQIFQNAYIDHTFNMHGWFFLKRHNTMAIGVAVDILGCTGSLEERAATLNRIILVALELKDSMGDLYAFSSIMKALDMPQVPNSSSCLPLLPLSVCGQQALICVIFLE